MIREEKLGDVNNDVGDTLNTIGFLQLRSGNIAEDSALSPLTKALEVRRALGNKSKVVSTLQNLASLYKKRKEFDLCMEMHSEILAVRQDEFGKNDSYGIISVSVGRFFFSYPRLTDLNIQGTNDEKVAEAWINLGNIQTTAGRMVEATISYEEALRIRTLSSGYNHKSVAHVLFKLGLLNSRQNNYTNAKQLFEEYIRLRAEEEDDPDQEMAQALTLVGDIQLDTGEKSKAQINWMSAMEIYLNLGYPEDHPKVVKLKLRQKALPTFGLFAQRRMSSVDVSRVAGDLSSVVDAPLSLFSRLAGVPSDMPDSTENNICVNH
jgi:tetratricopeptide (TPR) repeat protein